MRDEMTGVSSSDTPLRSGRYAHPACRHLTLLQDLLWPDYSIESATERGLRYKNPALMPRMVFALGVRWVAPG